MANLGDGVRTPRQRGRGRYFANAGVVALGTSMPWAAPGMPLKVLLACWRAMRQCGRWPLALADIA